MCARSSSRILSGFSMLLEDSLDNAFQVYLQSQFELLESLRGWLRACLAIELQNPRQPLESLPGQPQQCLPDPVPTPRISSKPATRMPYRSSARARSRSSRISSKPAPKFYRDPGPDPVPAYRISFKRQARGLAADLVCILEAGLEEIREAGTSCGSGLRQYWKNHPAMRKPQRSKHRMRQNTRGTVSGTLSGTRFCTILDRVHLF